MSPWHSGEASEIVSVSSATPEETTLPSSPSCADCDSSMGKGDDATANEADGESLSNRPSSSHVLKTSESPAPECEDECTALPPCGGRHQ